MFYQNNHNIKLFIRKVKGIVWGKKKKKKKGNLATAFVCGGISKRCFTGDVSTAVNAST
jgi:hypothetical protein